MHIDLSKRRALVTGGNSGLGAAMCLAFADAGARVAINYLDRPAAARALLETIGAHGGEAMALQADVTDAAGVEEMFARLDGAWGGIDILVNNAGIDGVRAESWESDPAEWMKVIDVNLKGAYLCARQALMRMKPRRSGVVLNITSVHEIIAWSGYSAYAASKAGLSMMSKTMGQEAAPHGVRVLCIAPGAISTPINADVRNDPASRSDLIDKIPLRRIGAPEDIANIAVMLAADAAGYTTATTVFVDGGMTAYPAFAHGG
jgi:NAD(P)-dependent dehydrogenase (short-subunit alcohol dehydrogenase family)